MGCAVERGDDYIKLTQPVLSQSYEDEFDIENVPAAATPAAPKSVMVQGDPKDAISPEDQSTYRSGVGKLLHHMKWSRPEIKNAVRELCQFASCAMQIHFKAMKRCMKYIVSTPKRGRVIRPNCKWDGNKDFEFVIEGFSDSEYAKCPDTRKSVGGSTVTLCGAVVVDKSKKSPTVALSVTEAELTQATSTAQDMLYVMRVMESMGLKVQKPMILKVDNKGAKDIAHNWSVGGRLRHVSVKEFFLRDLKLEGLIIVKWMSGEDMPSDLFTKNLDGPTFEKHTQFYCGADEYGGETSRSGGE